MPIDSALVSCLAPLGTLRAAINVGNPILATLDAATGKTSGVSVDLANELARRLNVPLEPVVVAAAGKSVEAVENGQADVGFFAIDPIRGARITFTTPYVLIQGCYLVRDDSPIPGSDEVDAPHHRVTVGLGSAYDLFLTRELKHAQIVRAPTSSAVIATFVDRELEVAAGVKQQLETDLARHHGMRLLDEPFMAIRQAMGVAKARGETGSAWLRAFVEEMKSSGFVAGALERHHIRGASLA